MIILSFDNKRSCTVTAHQTPTMEAVCWNKHARITKRLLFSIMEKFPFESLVVLSRFERDREEDILSYIAALTDGLKTTLFESGAIRLSPSKLIELSGHLIIVATHISES